MLQVSIPPQITCRPDWRSAKTRSGVRSLSELSIGAYSSAMSIQYVWSMMNSLCLSHISSLLLFVMRFCRCTPPPLSHMSDTPRGSTSVPGSGRTGWWGAWLCCNHVRSTDSDNWCLWHTTGRLYPGSSARACRSWGSLPGRPGQ